jgi:hypothetical protein
MDNQPPEISDSVTSQMNKIPINKQIQINQKRPTDICIPRMGININRKTIYEIFKKLDIGKIERISENTLKSDQSYKRIILKMNWNNTERAKNIKSRLENNEPVNIIYELPWFWRLVLSNK